MSCGEDKSLTRCLPRDAKDQQADCGAHPESDLHVLRRGSRRPFGLDTARKDLALFHFTLGKAVFTIPTFRNFDSPPFQLIGADYEGATIVRRHVRRPGRSVGRGRSSIRQRRVED